MRSPSLLGRAIVAVALWIGFYVFAIAIMAALLYLIYAEFTVFHRVNLQLTLIAALGAGAIAISIIPRIDRFQPPGPRLRPEDHPGLFDELKRTAATVGQAMPADVYLVPEVNAWVAQRGGLMGIGSRRVMGLGLPLLGVLDVSELRAVIAHEFGHFHGGDTALGPWIYRTRATIGRTLRSVGGVSGALQWLFLGYARLFMRITHAISRQQEFSADALAVRTAGAAPLISGLRAIHGAGAAFDPYWAQEVVPVLNAGLRPPLVDGFARFLDSPAVASEVDGILGAEEQRTRDPYDTHPPLRDRISAVERLAAVSVAPDDRRALTLLGDVGALEDELLASLAGAEEARRLQPVAWSEVAARVYLPTFEEVVHENGRVLAGMTPRTLPDRLADRRPFADHLARREGEPASDEATLSFIGALVGSALTLALREHGWTIDTSPGAPIVMRRGDGEIDPIRVVPRLVSGELTADDWRRQCEQAGIADVDLGRHGTAPGTDG